MKHNCAFFRVDGWYHAGNAVLLGDVEIGSESSIWFGAVLRGDDAPIRVGRRVNIQDLTMVHPDPDVPLHIEDEVTIGHRAIIHCEHIGSQTLIGMGAVLMERVRIGSGCLIAAGSVVPPGMVVPANSLVRGVPGKIAREVRAEERDHILYSVEKYATTARETHARYSG